MVGAHEVVEHRLHPIQHLPLARIARAASFHAQQLHHHLKLVFESAQQVSGFLRALRHLPSRCALCYSALSV